MSDLSEKVKTSIERLKAFEPKNGEGYYLAFSGGKDSVVCKALMDMAGVKYDSTYRVTSVDPPELVQFIKEKHPDVKREVPRYKNEFDSKGNPKPITMWNLIPKKMMPPTMIIRYCCHSLKESGGDGRLVVTGVRWAESFKRKQNQGTITVQGNKEKTPKTLAEIDESESFRKTKFGGFVLVNDNDESRRMVESCYKRHKTTINPIIDWTDKDVWDFIKGEHVPYCELYNEGFHRIGCIGCPMAQQHGRERDFARWPKYKNLYLMAFDKMLEERRKRGKMDGVKKMGTTAMDVYNWWMGYKIIPGQLDLFDMMEEEDDE